MDAQTHVKFSNKRLLVDHISTSVSRVKWFIWAVFWAPMLNIYRFICSRCCRYCQEPFSRPFEYFSTWNRLDFVRSFTKFRSHNDERGEKMAPDGESKELRYHEEEEGGVSELCFGFKFQTVKDFHEKIAEAESSALMASDLTLKTSQYQISWCKDVGGFAEEPKAVNLTVQEHYASEVLVEPDEGHRKFKCLETEEYDEIKAEDFVCLSPSEQGLKLPQQSNLDEHETPKDKQIDWLEENFLNDEHLSYGFGSLSEELFNRVSGFNDNDSKRIGLSEEIPRTEEIDCDYIELDPHTIYPTVTATESEEFRSFETPNKPNNSDNLPDFSKPGDDKRIQDFDAEDGDEPHDAIAEHRNLIERMKTELKGTRSPVLPTILEEFETSSEDLMPPKIGSETEKKDQMGEIQEFYKIYSDKMRKLDVLNYQTLQAIGFLQLRQPMPLTKERRSAPSSMKLKSLLMADLFLCNSRRIHATDQVLKLFTDLRRDLEAVYVGQVCASWEFLRWLYDKSKEMTERGMKEARSYNRAANEFQQFRVLLQRFTEEEPFQGHRVQNYTEKRCFRRGLLQVPNIKDDIARDRKGRSAEAERGALSAEMLSQIIEESMHTFWDFLRADKDYGISLLRARDCADSELLTDIKSSLQKKEKRLRDVARTGNCIARKVWKREGILGHQLLVSRVELRLVSRVASLPWLTGEQLLWCQAKLNGITFVDRQNVRLEPSFMPFPC